MSGVLRWWHALFDAPPSPSQDLVEARRKLRVAIVRARIAARRQRQASLDQMGGVVDLIRDDKDP